MLGTSTITYRASVRHVYFIDQVHGIIVSMRSPGDNGVAVLFQRVDDDVHASYDRGVREDLFPSGKLPLRQGEGEVRTLPS